MSEELLFDFEEKIFTNLSSLTLSQSELEERRICELSELAYEAAERSVNLFSSGMGVFDILSVISESVSIPVGKVHDGAMNILQKPLSHYLETLSSLDKAVFSSLLVKRLAERGIKITEQDFLSASKNDETFVYVKNPYADEAYDVFSQEFDNPTVRYCKDFKEGLSMVGQGAVGYCLLPLEDSGSRIKSVQELIFKGDFKISAVTPVFGFDGNADMKYCLVSKNYFYPEFDEDDDRYLELRLSKDRDTPLSDLLLVAESFGLDIFRVNSVDFVTDDGERAYYSVLIKNSDRDFLPLLIYILLFTHECTPLGIYKNLE